MRLILLVLMISLNTLPFSSDTTDALWMYLTANHAPLVVDDISEDSEKKDEDLTARNSLNLDEGLDQDVAALRRYVEVRLLSMREGEEKLNRKITAILSERHENWQKEYDWFNRQALSLHGEINLYTTLESRIQSFQQARSPEKPKMDQIPEEALDYLANGELSLAMGAPGSGPGFSRACPAEILDGQLIEGSIEPGMADSGSSGLMMPVRGVLSAGTWAYPGGGLHLGMDIAASMYSPLYAPANGVILYAANPVQDGGGYLGNWVGWPFGGGNTIAMICQSGGSLYGVTFCHLSSRIMVRAGQQVHQGDLLAYTGNSGNSTGPHTHIELFAIHTSFAQAVSYFQQGADFSFGTGWSLPKACSSIACKLRPELYF